MNILHKMRGPLQKLNC